MAVAVCLSHSTPRHGGALAAAAARWRIPLSGWLDLSTGINPEPYPAPPLAAADLARLPDPADLEALVATARAAYGVAAAAEMAAVPGSDIALRLVPLLRPPGRVAILSPTYSGHAEGWRAAGHAVEMVASLEEAAGAEAIVLANPNNPDGRLFEPDRLLAVLRTLPPDGLLLVDEAFADLAPGSSLTPHLTDGRLVVLRSFGKFYGQAGLRLGFVIGSGDIVRRLTSLVGDWPLSGPAVRIGTAALADRAWQQATLDRLAAARVRLDALLDAHGLAVAGGTNLFRLVRCENAIGLHEAMAAQGILTRVFGEIPGAIRFGLPPDEGFARLEAALGEIRTRGTS